MELLDFESFTKENSLISVFCKEKEKFSEYIFKKFLNKNIKCNLVNDSSIYPDLTPSENIAFFKTINTKKENFKELINEILADVPDKKASKLDLFRQKKVQLACSLTNNPQVVIFLEPTFGLKKEEGEVIKNYLKKVREKVSVLVITTILEELDLGEKIWLVDSDFKIKEITQSEKEDYLKVSTTVVEVASYA